MATILYFHFYLVIACRKGRWNASTSKLLFQQVFLHANNGRNRGSREENDLNNILKVEGKVKGVLLDGAETQFMESIRMTILSKKIVSPGKMGGSKLRVGLFLIKDCASKIPVLIRQTD